MSVFQKLAAVQGCVGVLLLRQADDMLIFMCMPALCGSYMLCFVQHGCLTVKAAVTAWLGVQYVEQ